MIAVRIRGARARRNAPVFALLLLAGLTGCRGGESDETRASTSATRLADGIASVYLVDVDGQRKVFLTRHKPSASDEDLQQLQAALDSIHIEA